MLTLKPILRVLGALVPTVYFGCLAYYFYHISGSMKEVENNGLGPTVIGLIIVTLLFGILLIVQTIRLVIHLRSPEGGRDKITRHNDNADEEEFDADAVITRYMARQAAEAASTPSAAPPRNEGGGPAKRPGFGRKGR